ncbi:unnamed protein product [Lactuca virosa]|uniref:Uncharacterized protein n=1 Tax=Lactuca virosa TaxID=75947 RepID=A0AAU9NS49_9ASTR|nr:unnamed protein product [Lactuca virosa]
MCVLTRVMESIQESVWVNIDGKYYQVYVKEVAQWEPDVAENGSFIEKDNNSIGSFCEGEDESFGLNSDKENEEYDQNHEDDNVNEVNSETEPVQEVGKSDEAGNDEIGNNIRPPNASVPLVGIGSGSGKRIVLDNMENVQSEDQRSSNSISKPPGFGSKVLKESRGSIHYSNDNPRKSWSTGSLKILKKANPSVGVNSCEEVSRFIKLGKILGYDVENAKADLKNHLVDHFDIPMEGRKFTRGDKAGIKLSRLDRFLISESLIDVIPDISCITLYRRWSDHCPVLLKEDQNDYGPISFKLFNSWLQMDGFFDEVSQVVRDFSPDCNLNKCINLKNKLKFVKAKFTGWQADMRKLKGKQRKECINCLLDIDNLIDSGVDSDDAMAERKNILQQALSSRSHPAAASEPKPRAAAVKTAATKPEPPNPEPSRLRSLLGLQPLFPSDPPQQPNPTSDLMLLRPESPS